MTVPSGWWVVEPARGGGVAKEVGNQQTLRLIFAHLASLDCGATSSPAGQTVDELMARLGSIPGVELTDLVIDGYSGIRVDFTMPADNAVCRWPIGSELGWHQQLSILDINGTSFVIDAAYAPGTTVSDRAQLQAIVDSIELH